jgi:hypothetical protein
MKIWKHILYKKYKIILCIYYIMKIHFLTFGGPSDNYHDAVKRIHNQAIEFNMFTNIYSFTEKDLMEDTEFFDKHSNFILNNPRGYGYWIWKPYLIKKTLEKMDMDDILLFLDCGCELNINGKNRMHHFINLVNEKKIIGTGASSSDYTYTKMDLIKFLNMDNNIELLKKPHMQAGCVLMKKCDIIVNLYNEVYEIASNNYNLLDDSPSNATNFNEFKEHRHDQSIFNLLVKKYDLINYDLDPTDCNAFPGDKEYLRGGITYPIWTCRNRTGISLKNS